MRPAPPESLEDFLHVAWDPAPAEARAATAKRRFVAAVSGLVVTLLLWGGYYAWSRHAGDSWRGTGLWGVTAVVLGLYVALLVVRLVVWRVAVRRRRRVGDGEVVTASWPGLQIAGHYWDWDSFAAADRTAMVVTVTGRSPGPADRQEPAGREGQIVPEQPAVVLTLRGTWRCGDRYLFTTPDGPWECPVEALGVTPAALEQALRLYSRGRCLVDLSGISH
ncbi:hypothetical protein [Raineyella sp.]|uniref:Uncharacterized protein n=1 Tax=bioreactor metagenome TaxID=1076179 RepID=A0A644Y1N2_9ZZZZ|nr:hypothetical protein [Raineyella sp.]MEA5153945.1 hypothetical protein [Raineyella sp.]